jgi:hypothetical protein
MKLEALKIYAKEKEKGIKNILRGIILEKSDIIESSKESILLEISKIYYSFSEEKKAQEINNTFLKIDPDIENLCAVLVLDTESETYDFNVLAENIISLIDQMPVYIKSIHKVAQKILKHGNINNKSHERNCKILQEKINEFNEKPPFFNSSGQINLENILLSLFL